MNHNFKIGDVVCLNSGGVLMTISCVYPSTDEFEDKVQVMWTDESEEMNEWEIPVKCLQRKLWV